MGGRSTYIDELERVPDVEEGARGLFEPDQRGEAEDVDGDVEELVDDLGGGAEDVYGGFGDALEG